MKKNILFIIALIAVIKVQAQQDAMLSQYMFNGMVLNPAYAGSHKYWGGSVVHRNQWTGFEGAPKTSVLALDGPLLHDKMGLGFILAHDKIGVTQQTDFYANYAYKLPLHDGKLAFGLRAGVSHYTAKLSELVIWDNGDNNFMENRDSELLPKFGFGTYYYTDRWYAGLSIPTLIAYDPDNDFSFDLSRSSDLRRHYYLTAGYVYPINEAMQLKPSFLLKQVHGAPLQADINMAVLMYNALWLGASYRTGDAISAMLEYQVSQSFRIGYSYDYTTSVMNRYSGGTHEIRLGYDFHKEPLKIKTPRFF